MQIQNPDCLPGTKRHHVPAVALGLAAGAALCLALPSLLCLGECRALENTALDRPSLANEEPEAVAGDPLADALYRSRVLYGSQGDGEGEALDFGPEEVRAVLSDALDALQAAGVTDEAVTRAAEDILWGEAEEATARRLPDGTRSYAWAADGQEVRMVWHPDLQLPLEFAARGNPDALPGGSPQDGLEAWTAFLGQQDAGDWQQLPELDGTCTVYSPGRELCLYLHREEGLAVWQVCSLSSQEAGELAEMLIDRREDLRLWEQTLQEAQGRHEE